jgi:hypothetical protein
MPIDDRECGKAILTMPLILTRAVKGRPEESPTRLGDYHTLAEAAQALAAALKAYPEYGSDPEAQCWWAKDKLGRTYAFEVTRERPTRLLMRSPL